MSSEAQKQIDLINKAMTTALQSGNEKYTNLAVLSGAVSMLGEIAKSMERIADALETANRPIGSVSRD